MDHTLERCGKREYQRSLKAYKRGYVCAQGRDILPRTRRFERGYIIARHFAEVIAERQRDSDSILEQLLHEHVERWKNETGHLSSITKATAHPSYLRIIGLA